MAGEAVQSPTDVVDHLGGHPFGQWAVETDLGRVPGVHVLGQPVYLGLGEPEGLGHITEHRLGPVGDHVGHHRRTLPPVLVVTELDHLLPAIGLEVDVDVGWAAPLLGEEPLEGEMEPDRVDPGQPETAAHRRVGPRAPDLAVDVLGAGEVHDVLHHQEVTGKAQGLDDVQLVLESAPRTGVDTVFAPRVHVPCPFPGEMTQILHLVPEVAGHGEIGQIGRHQPQIEGEPPAQLGTPRHRPGVTGEAPGHLGGMFQVSLVTGRSEPIGDCKGAAASDSGQHLGEVGVFRVVIVDLVGGDGGEGELLGHLPHQVVAWIVLGHAVMPELEMEPGPEQLTEPGSFSHGATQIPSGRSLGHCAGVAPGEDMEIVVGRGGGQVVPVVDRVTLFPPHLGTGHQIGQAPVPVGGSGEQDQMIGLREVRRLRPVRADAASSTEPALTPLGSGMTMLIPFLGGRYRVTGAGRIGLETDLDSVDGG